MGNYRYIFGPVLSRRLGLSLGVDLVEHKTCTLNCVYCECGRTTNLTLLRKEYVKTQDVIYELSDFLSKSPGLDYITFSGSGEPTLNSKLGDVVKFLKENFKEYKIALLTNGTLFTDESLIDEVKDVDLIVPSLDAASTEIFKRINRPHKGLKIERIIDGLINLREKFKNKIYLEIFIVPGLNDSEEEIKRLSDAVKRIKPDKIQLNSLDRPPAVQGIKKAEYSELIKIATYFEPIAEIVGRYEDKNLNVEPVDIENLIVETISRRPCTREELRAILSLRMKEVDSVLDRLINEKRVKVIKGPRGDYYGVA